ncbi:hypothetical protein NMG60_11024274 [Bertholletia excelsa]
MGKSPHVVLVPYPAQGHVKNFIRLAYRLAERNIKVSIVTTQSMHDQITKASPAWEEASVTLIGSAPDFTNQRGQSENYIARRLRLRGVMQTYFKDLLQKMNGPENAEKVSFVLSDVTLCWILDVPREMGIKCATFWAGAPAILALVRHIPKLIEEGIINEHGDTLKSDQLVQLSEEIPAWSSNELPWSYPRAPEVQRSMFDVFLTIKQSTELPSWILCNTFHELHPAVSPLLPNLLPIGPLLASQRWKQSSGSLHLEDHSCLTWLDQFPPSSAVYVSFGSTTELTPQQFNELALGLELAGRPFLWVVRLDFVNSPFQYPDGFKERVAGFGKIVEWAPQEEVLAHPSIACFFTHCGWNSTVEGLTAGVPFLCMPYFADHFHDRNYICDDWKVGIKLDPDDQKIISRHEIKTKLEKLLSDKAIKENALKWKEKALRSISEDGSSSKNVEAFISHLSY